MKDDEDEQRGPLDGASADQQHHFWCCLPLHWKPLLYDQVATIFLKDAFAIMSHIMRFKL